MVKLEVFDPPLCCPTGVCGPAVDPVLVGFAADLDWLRRQGVAVERFNLAQQPAAFVANPLVREALAADGTDCLPLVLADGVIRSRGRYPARQELAGLAGLACGSGAANLVLPMAGGACCPLPAASTPDRGAESRGGSPPEPDPGARGEGGGGSC